MELYQEITSSIRGKECWHVGYGGAAGTVFQLHIGDKLRRDMNLSALKMPFHIDWIPSEIDEYEGEIVLLVWCTWRLDGADGPLTSSDDTIDHVGDALKELKGRKIIDARIDLPAWDLHLFFSDGLTLRVFCDHMPGAPSFRYNWDMAIGDKSIEIGLGSRIEVGPRDETRKTGCEGDTHNRP
jgi:hypothetical protein